MQTETQNSRICQTTPRPQPPQNRRERRIAPEPHAPDPLSSAAVLWQDSEYEDDCEAEDAYSDTFEVEDADEDAEEAESEANSPPGNIAGNIIGNIVGSVSAAGADPPETGPAVGRDAISEPSDSASRYSEPEEAPIAEAEEESEYSENLEVEAEVSDAGGRDYYTPSEASNPDAGVDVRQSFLVLSMQRAPGHQHS